VLDGVEEESTSLGKHCYVYTPDPILTSSNRARVVFQGSAVSSRAASRVGVSVSYEVIIPVNECEIDNGGCHHLCVDTFTAYTCSCRDGYDLDEDKHRCIDIDECSTNQHGCSQDCENSEGSYTCSCREDYFLNEDGRTCSISCGRINTGALMLMSAPQTNIVVHKTARTLKDRTLVAVERGMRDTGRSYWVLPHP
jgi:hypothetical protein